MPTSLRSWVTALALAAVPVACGGTYDEFGPGDSAGDGHPDAAAPVARDAGAPEPDAPAASGPDAPVTSGPDASGAAQDSAPPPPVDSGPASGPASEGGTTGDAASPVSGAMPALPAPTGMCPTFSNGMVTFSPAGIPARSAQVFMSSAAATTHGPLILYWYATYSSTAEVQYSLNTALGAIEDAGGIVVAPQADPSAGMFNWYLVNGSTRLDDFQVADEIVACAAKNTGIDTKHIHSMGMSAGALQTTAMSFLRSNYLASVVTYSGGMQPGFSLSMQDPNNKFAALIFDGGSGDNVFGVDFQAASQTYYTTLKSEGHFAAICNHGMGHMIPAAAAPSVWAFFQANGFGVDPSPYAGGLPASFPGYCML